MNYYDLRKVVQSIIPRTGILEDLEKHMGLVKEKGRKANYHQYNLETSNMTKLERNLNQEEMGSFLEVSLRAMHCPMPLNADVWDGLRCSYGCRYCLPSGTKIRMYDGSLKNIERIKRWDRIISYNTETNLPEISEVTEIMVRKAQTLVSIKTSFKEVRLTPEHPVFTKRGWINAENVKEGDEVLIW